MKPRIEDMHPQLRERYQLHAQRMINAGIRFRLACVIRTRAEQEAIYAQGREPLEEVNAKRMTADMRALPDNFGVIIKGVQYAYKDHWQEHPEWFTVTHTKNSRHFPDENGFSHAYDIELFKSLEDGGAVHWDLKYDGQGDQQPDYIQAAAHGRACGLDCGAFWEGDFQDYPHYQMPKG